MGATDHTLLFLPLPQPNSRAGLVSRPYAVRFWSNGHFGLQVRAS